MSPIKVGPRVWGRKNRESKQVARNDPDVWNRSELSARHISTPRSYTKNLSKGNVYYKVPHVRAEHSMQSSQ